MKSSVKSKSYPKVCIALMIKNEEERILTTLKSTFGVAHEVYVYDTGSTDRTLDIVREWGEDNNIPVYIKNGEWDKNFSKHRNILLEWIDTDFSGDFIIMMDANDELKNSVHLRNWFKKEHTNNTTTSSYLVHQQWLQGNTLDYHNVRIIKPRCGWRYQRRIHEVIVKDNGSIYTDYHHERVPDEIMLFQDRSFDQHKSSARLDDDIEALLLDAAEYDNDTRSTYYLAQTYNAKNDYENAYKYYLQRSEQKGYEEEIFHSLLNLGILSIKLEKPFNEISGWFLHAYKFWRRAEPLAYLSKYCLTTGDFNMGLMFATEACSVGYPINANEPVDQNIYLYQRFLLKAVLCCRLDLLYDAQKAIGIAYDNAPNNEQVKEFAEAIDRKIKIREEEDKKRIESLKSTNIRASIVNNTETMKMEWLEKWKKAYLTSNPDKSNLDSKILNKLAESAYNKIFG